MQRTSEPRSQNRRLITCTFIGVVRVSRTFRARLGIQTGLNQTEPIFGSTKKIDTRYPNLGHDRSPVPSYGTFKSNDGMFFFENRGWRIFLFLIPSSSKHCSYSAVSITTNKSKSLWLGVMQTITVNCSLPGPSCSSCTPHLLRTSY